MKRLLLALALLLPVHVYAAGIIMGPMSSGSPQGGGSGTAPVVTAKACTIASPVTGFPVALAGGGTCSYTATCGGVACSDINSVTAWAITAQSTASGFAINSSGVLLGGSAAASVPGGASTVTVTATNTTGTSPGVVQNLTVVATPVVAALSCTIQSPISNGVNVTKQGGGTCTYTATCGGGACSGGSAITSWAITASTCTNCYAVTSAGVVQGGTAAATVGNRSDTLTVTASNAGGTSPAKVQPIAAVTVPVINNQNFTSSLPLSTGKVMGTMTATPGPTSWAITAVTGNNGSTSDFAVSNAGVITATSSAAGDITTPGLSTITLTATNATGTSAAGTATVTLPSTGGPTLQVATNTQFGSIKSTFTQGMCRTAHYTRAGITTSQAVYPGWYVLPIGTGNYGAEQSTGNYTVSRWVEYPIGTYTLIDNAITVTGGTNTVGGISSVSIPPNTLFYEWYFLAGGTWPYLNTGSTTLSSALGEACNMAAIAAPATPGVSITDNGSFNRWAGPVAIIGPNSKGVAVLIVGDSRTIGVHDAADTTTDRGNVARSVGPTYDYINGAVSGGDPSEFLSAGGNQKALQQYVSHVVNEYGINFFGNRNMSNAAAWPFEARMQATFNGKHYVGTTLEPSTSSTDSWATDANQTITLPERQGWNTNRQGQSPFVDLSTPVTSPTANNKWLNNGSANAYTVDGLHESVGGYAQVATSAAAIIAAINAAPIVAATQPTVSLTQGGTVAYDTAAPKFGGSALSGGWGYNTGSFPGTIPATMECWYKANANPGGFYLFGQGNDGTGTIPAPSVIVSGSTLQYRYTGGPTATSNTVADGTWHHLAFVLQPGSFQLYDNGVQAASGSVSLSQAPLPVSGFEVKFNGNPTAPQVTNGELDECAVWNTAKYTGNFTPPTNAYNGNEAGLVMLYHFDGNMNGLSTLYNQITNGIPIVNSNGAAPCAAALPVTTGQTICTLTANNTPTTWSITAQSCANGFAINNVGVLSGGSGSGSLATGTCTVTVQASNSKGTSAAQAESVVLSGSTGSGLPAGVTLQAIDGETMDVTGLIMTHNYYGRNSFSRVTAGTFNPSWDSTSFWPIMSFYMDSHVLPRAVDLGYNVGIDDVFGTQVWSNYDVSKIWHYSAQPGAGGPPNPASDFVAGWYTDEPVTDTVDQGNGSPLFFGSQPGTSIAGGPTLITQTSHSIGSGNFGSSQGGAVGPPMTSVTLPNKFWTTPNPGSQRRGVDINGTDFYWFAYSTAANFRKPDCASMINHNFSSPACTTDQMARCSGYGNIVSAMRNEWFGNGNEPETVPATTPLGVFTENGAGNDAGNGSRQITPGEMTCSVWDAIIHGARATLYFYWVDVQTLATSDPIYVATKSTNALIKAQAQMLNAPFARDYLTLTVSDGNANSYVFPHWNSVVATGWFGGGMDAAVKWFGGKFYILATTKYGESGYATKTATFNLAGGAGATATVIYSSDNASPPSIPISGGSFSDSFPHPWSVRIYRID